MNLLQTATGITKCDDYYKLRQYNVYYADHGFLRSISRKRLTSLIFKVSGRPLGGVSAMALNNILATATHKAAQKQYGGGTRPPNSLRYRTSPTSKQQRKTRQLHKKERKPEAVQKEKKKTSADDRTNYDHLLGNWESHRATRLQLLLAEPINRTVNVTMNIFQKPVKLRLV